MHGRQQRVILLEGPDGCGKTEIARALSRRLDVPYYKYSGEREDWRTNSFKDVLVYGERRFADLILQTGTSVILDRGYPSEWVYSQVFGRETDMSVLKKVDETFSFMDAYIVIPLREDYSLNREDDLVGRDFLPLLHEKYLEFVEWTSCDVVCLYVDGFGTDTLLELDAVVPLIERATDRKKFKVVTTVRI